MKYEQFEAYLDNDLAWRKKEISELLFLAKEKNSEVVFKSLILLLYAHWEGYIKRSSKLYIKYISELKLKISELSTNFKAVALKENISRCIDQKDALTLENELLFLKKFLKKEKESFKARVELDNDFENSIIDTGANLKPQVFKNIIAILGLRYKQALKTREHYINSHLLSNRNAIGHGSPFDPTKQTDFALNIKDLEKLKDVIFSIIDNFREELLEYVHNEFYFEAKALDRKKFEDEKEKTLELLFSTIEDTYK